jgi:hypothetical protein
LIHKKGKRKYLQCLALKDKDEVIATITSSAKLVAYRSLYDTVVLIRSPQRGNGRFGREYDPEVDLPSANPGPPPNNNKECIGHSCEYLVNFAE